MNPQRQLTKESVNLCRFRIFSYATVNDATVLKIILDQHKAELVNRGILRDVPRGFVLRHLLIYMEANYK